MSDSFDGAVGVHGAVEAPPAGRLAARQECGPPAPGLGEAEVRVAEAASSRGSRGRRRCHRRWTSILEEDHNLLDRLGAVVDESFEVQAAAAEEVQLCTGLGGPGEDGQSDSQDVYHESGHDVLIVTGQRLVSVLYILPRWLRGCSSRSRSPAPMAPCQSNSWYSSSTVPPVSLAFAPSSGVQWRQVTRVRG